MKKQVARLLSERAKLEKGRSAQGIANLKKTRISIQEVESDEEEEDGDDRETHAAPPSMSASKTIQKMKMQMIWSMKLLPNLQQRNTKQMLLANGATTSSEKASGKKLSTATVIACSASLLPTHLQIVQYVTSSKVLISPSKLSRMRRYYLSLVTATKLLAYSGRLPSSLNTLRWQIDSFG
mgnify:CR=1 FL=1